MQLPSEPAQSPRSKRLEGELTARIRRHGPLTFADFMQAALYTPELGYYCSEHLPWGPDGDYLTAPQVHPALGRAIAGLAVQIDAALGSSGRFDLVEVGGGNGALARAVLDDLRESAPALWERLAFHFVDAGHDARPAPELPEPGGGLSRLAARQEPACVRGLVYANELLDAFPVHRVRLRQGVLEEAHVDVAEDRLFERYLPPSTPALAAHLEANGAALREGQVAEICLVAGPWVERIGQALDAGGVLLVDYGHPTEVLYGESRPAGTLVAQHRFVLSDDLLMHPGDRDLTAHVDFGHLQRTAEATGLSWAGRCSLRVFLIGSGATAGSQDRPAAERLALRHLLVAEIADSHQVVFAHRGLGDAAPAFGRSLLEGA